MDTPKPKYSILDHRVAGWYLPWMMKGLTPTSSPLEAKIRLMKNLGYDGVGTSWWDLVSYYQERGPLDQLRRLSTELNFPLTAYGFVADGWAFGQGAARRNAIALAKSSLDLAHAAGCEGPYLVGPFDSGDVREAAKVFRELAQYAESLGLRLALEFIGVSAQIKTVAKAWELLELAGVSSAGIALDSYHFFAGGSSFTSLKEFPTSRILVAHLADAAGDLKDPALDLDRRMPGDGELQLVPFVQLLRSKGFSGYWHVECIEGRDYASDLAEVGYRGLTSLRLVIEASCPTTLLS
jgi:4-hydroxyphenylpyruvate dioxygenase